VPVYIRILIGFIVAVAASPVRSADVPNAGTVLETVKGTEQQQQLSSKPAPELGVEQAFKPALEASAELKVKVTDFRITGATVYTEKDLLPLLRDYTGKELALADLERAVAAITLFYRSHGYPVAHAYLPAQDIEKGVVEIAVLEGRVAAVKLEVHGEKSRLSEAKAQKIVMASVKTGDVVKQDELERGLLLLNDLPAIQVKSTLVPGASVGTSDLIVEATARSLLDGSVDADTFGNRFTGTTRVGGTLNLNSPAGQGDQLTLRALTAGSGLSYGRLSYTFPVNDAGTRLGAAYSYVDFKLSEELSALQAKGDAGVASLFVLHPFIRSRRLSLYGSLGFDHKIYDNEANFQTTSNKSAGVWLLGVSGESRDRLGRGGLNQFGLTFTRGSQNLNGSPDQFADALTANTQGRFNKLDYNFTRLQYLSAAFSLRLSLSGQLTTRNLDSAEQFVLGGPYGVRAYPQGEASGDEGYLVSAEAHWDTALRWTAANAQFIGFVDTGGIQLHDTEWSGWQGGNARLHNRYSLSGAGVGCNLSRFENYLVRASYAWKLGENPGRDLNNRDSDNTAHGGRFWIQFAKWF
jgi:hemolysin activation/secretion protein